MKHFSEVQKITGLTRKQLQYYESIKLVEPTVKNEQGHWLYDDEAIGQLGMVQLFAQAGYPRRAIKKILTMNQEQLVQEFERLEERLEAERRRLEGVINCVVMTRSILRLPPSVIEMIGQIDPARMYAKRSFGDQLKMGIELSADAKMDEEGSDYATFLTVIAMMHDRAPEDEAVQRVMGMLFDRESDRILKTFFAEAENVPPKSVLIRIISDEIEEMLGDVEKNEEMRQLDREHLDSGGWAFLKSALRVYQAAHMQRDEAEEVKA